MLYVKIKPEITQCVVAEGGTPTDFQETQRLCTKNAHLFGHGHCVNNDVNGSNFQSLIGRIRLDSKLLTQGLTDEHIDPPGIAASLIT